MALNIAAKRVHAVCNLIVKNADGSPMLDDNNEPITATIHGPASKVWQVANATKRRKAMKRSREAGGKFEAALDGETEDAIEFLCAITKSFNGLEYNSVQGDAAIVRAIYADPELGFIRDHMEADATNWENFMNPSPQIANAGSGNMLG